MRALSSRPFCPREGRPGKPVVIIRSVQVHGPGVSHPKDTNQLKEKTHMPPWNAALDRMTLNIMGTDAIQNVGVTIDRKGKAVSLGNPCFPDVAALRITLAFHLFGSQRGMARIGQQKTQRPIKPALDGFGKALIVTHKAMSKNGSHTLACLRARIASSAISNGPSILPALRSSKASCIMRCQASV